MCGKFISSFQQEICNMHANKQSYNTLNIAVLQHAPTNKLLYAKDIPKYKQEVKLYYKRIREQSPITDSEMKNFLQESSKVLSISVHNINKVEHSECKDQQWTDDFSFQKHENEFNEAGALRELYKFIEKYFKEVSSSFIHCAVVAVPKMIFTGEWPPPPNNDDRDATSRLVSQFS